MNSKIQRMHDKVVFHPIKGEKLTKSQKQAAIRVLMFLKQKQCGKIKVALLQTDKSK